ncbi:hypothetical protein PLANPX_3778 [Lacipirellula parvula]|uniref:Uncharacterized protein n=1 Tax=Lacipirellula parvula TaxID=2650471 RepID=A0A5K7XIK6_9BACT|nr:hypothetical protein PLANPX_3778 [Lacipirellula parvula]
MQRKHKDIVWGFSWLVPKDVPPDFIASVESALGPICGWQGYVTLALVLSTLVVIPAVLFYLWLPMLALAGQVSAIVYWCSLLYREMLNNENNIPKNDKSK